MSVVEELGDDLARATIEVMEEIGDERFYFKVAKVIGSSSPTLEEAFLTAMRVRLAAERGRNFLQETVKAQRSGQSAPTSPPDSAAH